MPEIFIIGVKLVQLRECAVGTFNQKQFFVMNSADRLEKFVENTNSCESDNTHAGNEYDTTAVSSDDPGNIFA